MRFSPSTQESGARDTGQIMSDDTAATIGNGNFRERGRRLRAAVTNREHTERIVESARRDADRARDAMRRRADTMEIPRDEDLRAAIETADQCVTDAMRAVRAALAWRAVRCRGLVLVLAGPTGVGKTVAACTELVRREHGLYVRAATICSAPRTGYSTTEDRWTRWAGVSMLVIDDAGTERSRPELIGDLLISRYDDGLPTILTTNLSRDAMTVRYLLDEHGRLADRLVHAQGRGISEGVGPGGHPWYVRVDGPSLRAVDIRERLRRREAR